MSPDAMPASIFVSYSHQDSALVEPVVSMLRGFVGLVFHDVVGIRPGTRWREEIDRALLTCDLLVLFWCIHSAASKEVEREYQRALAAAKNVLPLLLDGTPLPEKLMEFQWVDLRPLVRRVHEPEFGTPLRHDGIDSGAGSLKQAIRDASITPGVDAIRFNIGANDELVARERESTRFYFAQASDWPEYEVALALEAELRQRGFSR
jgi:TIR domain